MPYLNKYSSVLLRLIHSLVLPAALATLITLNGCATLEQMVQKPTAAFSGMHITNADLVQSTAVFDFKISNPNAISIHASRITYDLKLNGRNFVNGRLDRGITLPAGGTSILQVPITMAYLDFFESAAQLWRTKSADYALTGGFSVGPFIIPFQAHGTFDLPKLPKISLNAIEIKSISLFGATLNCKMQMDNPNSFDLPFKRLDYNLKLGGTSFGKISNRPPEPVGKNSRAPLDFTFDVSFAQLGRSAYNLLQGANSDFKLDGGMIFDQPGNGERNVPFNLSGRVPLVR